MVHLNSHLYYRQREQHERRMAERSIAPDIAEIHREMAQRYALLCEEAMEQEKGFRSQILL